MNNIEERLDSVREKIQEPEFLAGKGLSNEVGIWTFCYDPEDEMAVRSFIERMETDQTLRCRVKIHNLYQIFLAACEDLDILDAIPDMEESDGSEYLLEQLHSAIGEDTYIEAMQYEPHETGDVLVLTGVGEVFPFMRMHSLLEAIQPHFSDVPLLVFYPGEFNGHQLKLFNKLKPNDYYRAFNVI